jgi:hypothetical protein
MKSTMFWDVMPCSPVNVHRSFAISWELLSDYTASCPRGLYSSHNSVSFLPKYGSFRSPHPNYIVSHPRSNSILSNYDLLFNLMSE